MVYKCAALNCRSGYSGENKNCEITFHSFPLHDKNLLQLWLKRLARKDFKPTKHSKVCSLHFTNDDFVNESLDKNSRRKRKRESTKLVRKRLKTQAFPTVFNNLPSYYTQSPKRHRSGLSTSSSRLENECARLEECCEAFLDADKVKNFDYLISKLSEDLQRHGYILHQTDQGAYLLHLSDQQPPSILATIFISKNLEVTIYQEQLALPPSLYKHIMETKKLIRLSQVLNLMAYAKSGRNTQKTAEENFKSNITKLLVDFLLCTDNEQQICFLKFAAEQFNLMFTSKHHRRYSPELLMMAFVIFSTSPRAYERLVEEKVIILPSTKTLMKITMNLDSKTGLDDEQYLQLRFSQLNAFDRNIIMIDEIYLSKRIEASGGQLIGLTKNCEVATTALCFMVKSLSSSYQDMVGIYPVKNLKAATQKKCFDKIMVLLHNVGFNVVAISVDNAAANRKFYKDFLCNGTWTTAIANPFTGGQIFLIFDPTHVIKNVYNNFLTKKNLYCLHHLHSFLKPYQQIFQILLPSMVMSAIKFCE